MSSHQMVQIEEMAARADEEAGPHVAPLLCDHAEFHVAVRGVGVVAACVDVYARSARHVAEHAMIDGSFVGQAPRPLQPVAQHGVAEADRDDFLEIGQGGC